MTTEASTSGRGVEILAANPMSPTNYAHARETSRLQAAPRCQAQAKGSGKSCRSPAMKDKKVCRVHGGKGGAPKGDANGSFRHGGFTEEAIALRRGARRLLDLIREVREETGEEPDAEAFRLLDAYRDMIRGKMTRAEKRQRNKALWAAGDRRRWGGECRKPHKPGRRSRWY